MTITDRLWAEIRKMEAHHIYGHAAVLTDIARSLAPMEKVFNGLVKEAAEAEMDLAFAEIRADAMASGGGRVVAFPVRRVR